MRRDVQLMMTKLWVIIKRNAGSIAFTVLALTLVSAGLGIAKYQWSWLHPEDSGTVSNSDTLRNVGLLIGGVIAFVFGLWRAWVAERQANASQGQAAAARAQVDAVQVQIEATQRQAETAQQSLLNERYQRGAEMMAGAVLTARLGGLFALQRLAEEYSEQYQVQVLRLFCAFVRDPDGDWETRTPRTVIPDGVLRHSLRQDVQAAVEGISSFLTAGIFGNGEASSYVDLRGARLSGIYLEAGDLSGVDFSYSELVRADFGNTKLWGAQLRLVQLKESNLRGTDLSHATISSADLADVDLNNARLNGTTIFGSNLDGATFYEATLAGTVFSNTSITQTQLDQSRGDPHNPPKFLDHPVDHSTGRPLHWHGEPLG